MCARGVVVWAIFATFFFFLIFHFLQILLFSSVSVLFSTGKFWKQPKTENFSKPKSKQAPEPGPILALVPFPCRKKKTGTTPGNSFRARLTFTQHTRYRRGGSTHTGSHVHSPPRKTSQQKKRTNERKNESPEPPSRNPANCTGRRANFSRTRSESGSTRARPHFRPGFAHKTPVFHSNSADRTQSRTRL